ncbi:LysR family transcriptional regulator [Neobacillus sp. MER 74]|uniref:LysR family transcriptional regulator n=1 Tax=Bacillaceae TaxID=186817 RepID=UPI000BFA7456|nr:MULTISPECIES: LysR family transcriptional regulator [Bacillaceae]MCM3117628.1 LysR family transcriptional regulator [Neobacillus sp. MER 74]PFP24833.1 LysR family transcriptional regulator [Bacillus sp. AFS073361]
MDQQLQVFVTVVEMENFSRAAEELHMTQPAVSQYIQSFERTMGTKLLERSNKFVRLNKAGEIVYHHAKEILGLYTKMHYLIDDLTNKSSGPLSIGASYTYGEYVLPHVIAKMHRKYPLITPTITIGNTKEIAKLVLEHQLDVGIVEGDFKDKNLVIEPFAEDSMYLVASPKHCLAQKNGEINISELEEETWIVRENGSGTREVTEKMFRLSEVIPKKSLEFGSTQLIKESVEAGLGVSLLSYWAIRKECSMGSLHVINVKQLPIKRKFSIVLRSPFQTKALSVFLELVRDSNKAIPD